MDTSDHTTIPLFPLSRHCTKCGKILPETSEYFRLRKSKGKVYLNSACWDCERAYNRIYSKTPQARINLKRYRQTEKGKRANRAAKQRPEYLKKQRAYRESERGKTIRSAATQRQRQKLTFRIRHRIDEERRRAKKQGLPCELTSADWQHALNYFNGRCAICGRPPGLFHVLAQDHWIPVSGGGGFTKYNIIPLCHSKKGDVDGCNNLKQNYSAEEWLIERYGKRKATKILAKIEAYFKSLASEDE